MKRALLILFILYSFLLPSHTHAQTTPTPSYAECDVCGYCQGQEAPANWNACAQCHYPGIVTDPNEPATLNKTLAIDPITQRAKQPAGGRYYTQLGCLDTGLTSFRGDSGAVGATINFILSRLLFPIAGTLAFGTIIFGAFLLLTAQGEQEKILRGKKLITSSIVGVIFTFSSIFIINFIAGDVLKIPGFAKGTKVTFVGYGDPTTENGVKTYPKISVTYDGKEIGKIESLRGTASTKEIYNVSLPIKINLTSNADIQKVRFIFTNDLNLTPASGYYNDRNVYNYKILFDDIPCTERKVMDPVNVLNPNDDVTKTVSTVMDENLHNYWDKFYYMCDSLAP